MNLSLEKLASYGVGSRSLTEADFYTICETDGIEIVWSDAPFSFWFYCDGVEVITLPKRLKGLKLLFAMLHELAHHWMHSGTSPAAAFHEQTDDKCEFEADAIALIALIPFAQIREKAFLDGSRYGQKLFNERCRLAFLYGV